MNLLGIEGLNQFYGGSHILWDVTLHVAQGSRTCLMGRNGMGKSTLLKLATGTTQPDAGTVTLGGSVKMGYFAQHAMELLDGDQTIFETLEAAFPRAGQGSLRALAGEVLNAIPVVQAYTAEAHESQRFVQASQQTVKAAIRRIRARSVLVGFVMVTSSAVLLWGLYMGTLSVREGSTTAGELGQTVFYVILLASAFAVLGEMYGDVLRAAGATERLIEGAMQDDQTEPRALSFDDKARMIQNRRSIHGGIIGLKLDRYAPGEAWSSLPYHPVFVGDAGTGVIHGGVVTTMLDESCGMAVQLALSGTAAIATLDLRIDYLRPATPGQAVMLRINRAGAASSEVPLRLRLDTPTTFGTAPDGSVLIASQRGTLYRLVAR